jgi:hypothetical protein
MVARIAGSTSGPCAPSQSSSPGGGSRPELSDAAPPFHLQMWWQVARSDVMRPDLGGGRLDLAVVHGPQRRQIPAGVCGSWRQRAATTVAMRGWARRAHGGVFLFFLFLID